MAAPRWITWRRSVGDRRSPGPRSPGWPFPRPPGPGPRRPATGATGGVTGEVAGRGQKSPRPALPWMAIPATAGTGAEATRNAVVGYPEKQFKASIRSELLLPRVALIDPEIQVNVPPGVTA